MTPDGLRVALAELASLQSKTARASTAIRIRAHARRGEVVRRLAELAPTLAASPEAQAEHQELVLEKGRLDRVLAAR